MFFIRTRHFVFLAIFIAAILTSGAVCAYVLLSGYGDKLNAERFLFFGFLGILLLLVVIVRLVVYNRQSISKMDKLVDLVTQNGTLPLERLSSFGKFGKKMKRIYSELVSLSERKSNRITQLNAVTDKMMDFIEIPLLLVDATGEIRKTSGGFLEKNKLAPGEIVGIQFAEYTGGIDFQTTLTNSKRSKRPVEIMHDKHPYTFYPVFSRENDVVFFLVAVGKHELFGPRPVSQATEKDAALSGQKSGRLSAFLKFFFDNKNAKKKK